MTSVPFDSEGEKMIAIDVLRDEYPGDDAWRQFVSVFRQAWSLWEDKDSYSSTLGDQEIAIVLTTSMGALALDWFTKPCGALGKRAPIDVLKNEPYGINIIRTLLMRMPS